MGVSTGAIAVSVLLSHLTALYGDDIGHKTFERLQSLLPPGRFAVSNYQSRISPPRAVGITERDAILITYGDQIQAPDAPPLRTLADFAERHLTGLVSAIHILPFYPYSSDDGFSVIDYHAVNPALGDWDDIARLGRNFRLMFDAVINHISAESEWFRAFLRDDPQYRNFFIVVPDATDLSRVVRPRTLPLLTPFTTPSGEKFVWTTFSADQVDLNYQNPDVLIEIIDTLLFYIAHGAEFIRLDAVAFLWKEFGTSCLHLPQTHRIIQLVRAMLDEIAPHVMLITETNVPHTENITYFGNGANEAQMIYNFALPPLVLHTFHASNALALSKWARGLTLPSNRTTFFNFLASHDGIGLNPVRGILTDAEIGALVTRVEAHGGLVSYKNNPDGTASPYELNINYFDALSDPLANELMDTQVARFITAQAIMLSLIGVPGIYFHSLLGSRGWPDGVAQTGQNRTINREKCNLDTLERELADPTSRRSAVLSQYGRLLRARAASPAFHPHGTMRVLDGGAAMFAVLREARNARVLCLHNVSNRPQPLKQDLLRALESTSLRDLGTGQPLDAPGSLNPYETLWLTP